MNPASEPSKPTSAGLGRFLVMALVPLWLVVVGAGLKWMLDYQAAPGAPAEAPDHWPATSALAHANDRPTLLLLLHPHCPCTRATLGELARITTRTREHLAVQIVFVVPHRRSEAWARSDLWRMATQVPGAHVLFDRDGSEARRFGSHTSGQALVYDETGALRFAGGITPGRGHAGDNAGEAAVVALAMHQGAARHTDVFGCSLAASEAPGVLRARECAP